LRPSSERPNVASLLQRFWRGLLERVSASSWVSLMQLYPEQTLVAALVASLLQPIRRRSIALARCKFAISASICANTF
jgi:hypothetical protein